MAHCLETKDSNCKNCYKCIRNCPIKSLSFTDGQAHIIRNECVLCGNCYLTCPQDAKVIRDDVPKVKELLNSGNEVYVSLAPSYVGYFKQSSLYELNEAFKKLGFSGVFETAVGATIVKKEYEKMVKNSDRSIIISSCCSSVNLLIEKHFPSCVKYLADVVSPMQAHAMFLKDKNKDAKVVFVGPCISKKEEAEKSDGRVDAVLTFDEVEKWFEDENIEVSNSNVNNHRKRANFFPISGGILRSMDLQDKYNYIVIDGMEDAIKTLKEIENGELENCFIEMSACKGSCVGGPVMKKLGKSLANSNIAVQKDIEIDDYDIENSQNISVKKVFMGLENMKINPNSEAIEEILRKMGKTSKKDELNCGTCGYNTCREKAIAVLQGKAELSMCLPYLKEKAESLSDTIITNTPNGIIVLNEQFEIQQMNDAAKKIFNLPLDINVKGSNISTLINPSDYAIALEEHNIYDKLKYLSECNKYVEETVIHDNEYHIIMSIMKNVTDEQNLKLEKKNKNQVAIDITDKVVEKQMRVVQEIASILGETTAETKIALTKLKETLNDE